MTTLRRWSTGSSCARSIREIQYRPARVLMQDFTGVPAVVDLAAMRDAMKQLGGDAQKINPLVPVHLVIDHSVMVDEFGTPRAFGKNVELEYARNGERYEFLKWGASAFDNFQVVPPGTGICHQVNLEYVAQCVWVSDDQSGEAVAYPDTLVGTDSHTTMVNGLGVLGWGVGGIEAEAAMLGQPVSMLIPEVVGFRLDGELKEGITATDLVLTGHPDAARQGRGRRFVEFYGPASTRSALRTARPSPTWRRNMARLRLLPDRRAHHRLSQAHRPRRRSYRARARLRQGAGHVARASSPDPVFTDTLALDMSSVEPSLAGPRRRRTGFACPMSTNKFNSELEATYKKVGEPRVGVEGEDYEIGHGDVMIAAITSCTNTSNPSVLVACWPRRAQGSRAWARPQAVGQDQPRPGQPGGHRLPR
jgi:aconitate hydratase